MHLDVRTFKEFMTLVGVWKQFRPDNQAVLHLDTEEGWSTLIEDRDSVKQHWAMLPDVAERMSGSNNFPVLRILLLFDFPVPQMRIDLQDNTPHNDVDRLRYETWVSLNSNIRVGRTSEFGLLSDFRAKLEEAQRSVGFRINFLSDRPKGWFAAAHSA